MSNWERQQGKPYLNSLLASIKSRTKEWRIHWNRPGFLVGAAPDDPLLIKHIEDALELVIMANTKEIREIETEIIIP